MRLSTLPHIHWEFRTQWSQQIRAVGLKWLNLLTNQHMLNAAQVLRLFCYLVLKMV